MVSSAETTTDTYSYEAFGSIESSSGTTVNAFKYVGRYGYYLNTDSNLMLLRARYYDNDIGRFITKDPYRGSDWLPQTLNRYIYVLNNPVNMVDPLGLMCCVDTFKLYVPLGWECTIKPGAEPPFKCAIEIWFKVKLKRGGKPEHCRFYQWKHGKDWWTNIWGQKQTVTYPPNTPDPRDGQWPWEWERIYQIEGRWILETYDYPAIFIFSHPQGPGDAWFPMGKDVKYKSCVVGTPGEKTRCITWRIRIDCDANQKCGHWWYF